MLCLADLNPSINSTVSLENQSSLAVERRSAALVSNS